jgi:ABC-type branched-subunit amino acid transport system substrate-binding protein
LRAAVVAGLACLLAGLAGCQSADPETALAVSDNNRPSNVPESETVGSGPVRLAVLLPLSSDGTERNNAADFRDGAELAMKDLGQNRATLTIYDTKGVPTEVTRLGNLAIQAGAKAIIGPTTQQAVSDLVSMDANKSAVILALTADIPPAKENVFAMMSDETDSATAIASYAIAAGRRNLVILQPDGFAPSSQMKIKQAIQARQGHVVGVVDYSSQDQQVATQIAKAADMVRRADAILLLSGPDAATAAAALRGADLITTSRPLLGTVGWSKSLIDDKNTYGALLALPGEAGLRQIFKSFSATFGRPPSRQAAYTYDAMAIVLGILRVLGPEAINKATLLSDKGFRGATGVFRFNGDGSIDRLLSVYVNNNGTLKQVKAAETSF